MQTTKIRRKVPAIIAALIISAMISCGGGGDGGGGGGGDSAGHPGPFPTTPPTTPSGLKVISAQGTSVTIGWDYSPNAMAYNIYRAKNPSMEFEWINSTPAVTYADYNLEENTTYYYRIAAYNPFGESPVTAYIDVTTGAEEENPLYAPSGLNVGSATSSSLTVSWNSVSGATGYRLYSSASSGGTYVQVGGNLTSTSYVNSGLSSDTTYYYKVRAFDDNGESELSSWSSGTTLSEGGSAPGTPTGISVGSATSTSLTVSWNSASGATGYRLYRSASAGGTYTQVGGDLTSTSYVNTGLASDTTYYYKVRAFNTSGESSMSAYQQGTTTSGGTSPEIITGTNVTNGTYSMTSGSGGNTSTITYIFTGSNCTKRITANGTTTEYYGTWSYSGVNIIIDVSNTASGMTTRMIETYNAGYTTHTGSRFFTQSWHKTSGGTSSIVGTYQSNFTVRVIISMDGTTYGDSTTTSSSTVTYNANNTFTLSTTITMTGQPPQESTTDGTWNAGDLSFVSYGGRYYLYGDGGGYYTRQ